MNEKKTIEKTLWVIDPSVQSAEHEGIRTVIGNWPGKIRVSFPALHDGDGPGPNDDYNVDGVVVMGSRASVHDDLPWLHRLKHWLTPIATGQKRVSVLGICFGHQLLAHLASANVSWVFEDQRKLTGVHDTVCESSSLFFTEKSKTKRVMVSHREQVIMVPEGYRCTATRKDVPIDAMEHVELPLYGVQFHPEARAEFAKVRGLDERIVDEDVVRDGDAILRAFRDSL